MAQQTIAPPTAETRFRMTYEDYLVWDQGDRTMSEWVDGEVTVFMAPRIIHQEITLLVGWLLVSFVSLYGRGKVLIAPFEMLVRGGRSSREPDVAYIAPEHLHRVTRDRVDGPADLVVEVMSDESVTRDRRDKLREYAEVGVPEYWLIDSREGQRGLTAYHQTAGGA